MGKPETIEHSVRMIDAFGELAARAITVSPTIARDPMINKFLSHMILVTTEDREYFLGSKTDLATEFEQDGIRGKNLTSLTQTVADLLDTCVIILLKQRGAVIFNPDGRPKRIFAESGSTSQGAKLNAGAVLVGMAMSIQRPNGQKPISSIVRDSLTNMPYQI